MRYVCERKPLLGIDSEDVSWLRWRCISVYMNATTLRSPASSSNSRTGAAMCSPVIAVNFKNLVRKLEAMAAGYVLPWNAVKAILQHSFSNQLPRERRHSRRWHPGSSRLSRSAPWWLFRRLRRRPDQLCHLVQAQHALGCRHPRQKSPPHRQKHQASCRRIGKGGRRLRLWCRGKARWRKSGLGSSRGGWDSSEGQWLWAEFRWPINDLLKWAHRSVWRHRFGLRLDWRPSLSGTFTRWLKVDIPWLGVIEYRSGMDCIEIQQSSTRDVQPFSRPVSWNSPAWIFNENTEWCISSKMRPSSQCLFDFQALCLTLRVLCFVKFWH